MARSRTLSTLLLDQSDAMNRREECLPRAFTKALVPELRNGGMLQCLRLGAFQGPSELVQLLETVMHPAPLSTCLRSLEVGCRLEPETEEKSSKVVAAAAGKLVSSNVLLTRIAVNCLYERVSPDESRSTWIEGAQTRDYVRLASCMAQYSNGSSYWLEYVLKPARPFPSLEARLVEH